MKSRYVIKFITPLAILGTIPMVSLLTSCSNSNDIIFANFESYMNPDVMDRVQGEAPTQFISYGTNEELQSKFDRYYDISIPSSYEAIPLMRQGSLLPIDYSRFASIQQLYNDGIIASIPQSGNDMKTSGLLTNAVVSAINKIDT
jgi:spermidine/putrescine-binding protein